MEQEDALITCQVLQGTTPHIKDMTVLEELVEKLKAHADKEECLMMWTPYTDRGSNGKFISLEDNSDAEFLPWQDGQPNGEELESGVAIHTLRMPNAYRDVEEDERLCAACKIKKDFVLQMRGACKDSMLDTKYQIRNVDSFVGLNGFTSTMIRYNNDHSQWEARSTEKPDFLATSKASEQTFLLGTQTWSFENDSHECSEG